MSWWFVAGIGPGCVDDLRISGCVGRLVGVTRQDLLAPCLEPPLQGRQLVGTDSVLGERGGPQRGYSSQLFGEHDQVESWVVFCDELEQLVVGEAP